MLNPTNFRTDSAPQTPSQDVSRATRNDDLERSSSRFAELVGKERKEPRREPTTSPKHAKQNDLSNEHLGESGDAETAGSWEDLFKNHGIEARDERSAAQLAHQFLGDHAHKSTNGKTDGNTTPASEKDAGTRDKSAYFGPTHQTTEDGHNSNTDNHQEPNSDTNLILQIDGPRAFAEKVSRSGLESIDKAKHADAAEAIAKLGDQIAERILIARSSPAGVNEIVIQVKDVALVGTEVRIIQDGARLHVSLLTEHAGSFAILASGQAELQARLGNEVTVNLAFEPDGLASRLRLEQPTAVDAGQQTDERRPGDDQQDQSKQRRDRRRESEDETQ